MEQAKIHLERARNILKHNPTDECLTYACLELRMCVEQIAYSKLENRLDGIPLAGLKGWQPRRVIETILEFDEAEIEQSITYTVSAKDSDGVERQVLSTHVAAISAKELGKIWQKLSSFLHVDFSKETQAVSVRQPSVKDLLTVANQLQPVTENTMDISIAPTLAFSCAICEFPIRRNSSLFQDGQIMLCPNPECNCEYIVSTTNAHMEIRGHVKRFDCGKCAETMNVGMHWLRKIKLDTSIHYTCEHCHTINVIYQDLKNAVKA